jgi:hypothetical protein
MMVALKAAVRADGPHFFGQWLIVAEQRPALPVASQRFGRKKAGAANGGDASALAPALLGAKTLGRVFDDGQPMLRRQRVNAVVIGHLAEQTDGQNGLGARGDGRQQQVHVDVEGVRLNIHENGPRSHQGNDLGRADPGEGNRNDFVARPDAQGAQRDLQRVRAAGAGDAMPRSDVLGQGLLQFQNFRPHDVLAVGQNGPHPLVNFRFVAPVLFFAVNEFHVQKAGGLNRKVFFANRPKGSIPIGRTRSTKMKGVCESGNQMFCSSRLGR